MFPACFRQAAEKVHGYLLPWSAWNRQGMIEPLSSIRWLSLGAHRTCSYELFHLFCKWWLVKMLLKIEYCFGRAKMSAIGGSMCFFYQQLPVVTLQHTKDIHFVQPSIPYRKNPEMEIGSCSVALAMQPKCPWRTNQHGTCSSIDHMQHNVPWKCVRWR